VYFPYVLAKPRLLLALIAGGFSGTLMDVLFKGGLVAPAAPGSIFAVYSSLAKGKFLGVSLTWIVALAVTFVIAALLLKTDRSEEGDLVAATSHMESLKGRQSIASSLTGAGDVDTATGPIHSIVFACDAGMGSSAMGASVLRRKIQDAGFKDVTVVNKAISNLTDDVDLVITHQDLTARARQLTGSARHVSVDNFMGSPKYDEVVELLRQTNVPATVGAGAAGAATAGAVAADTPASGSSDGGEVLSTDSIKLSGTARTMAEAIDEAGGLLVAAGAVDPDYVASMHERERSVSTFMGNGLAIPHGTNEAKGSIRRTALSFVRYADGVDWKGKPATFVVAIAGAGDDHLTVLSRLAKVFGDKAEVARLEQAQSPEEVQEILRSVG
jgi:PTS system mannitol-specific IIC component